MLTSFEAIPHSLSRQWIIGNRVVNSIKNQHRKLSRNLSHEENEEDRYRTCSDSSCRFFSRALLCIRVSILPNFVCTVRFRRHVCMYVHIRGIPPSRMEKEQYRSVSSCTISRWPQTPVVLHPLGLSDRKRDTWRA